MSDTKELKASLHMLAGFALTQPAIIRRIYRVANYNDEPKSFTYSAEYAVENESLYGSSTGTSFNKTQAIVRALAEAIERYCLNNTNKRNTITTKISDLHVPFLDPYSILSFSKAQLQKASYRKFSLSPTTKFKWIQGYVELGRSKVLIPAQLVYTNYQLLKKEPYIRFPISTGAAAHTSREQALYAGICEVVERDAFMIYYLNRLAAPKIDLSAIRNNELGHIFHTLRRYKLDLTLFDMSTDVEIPVYVAVLLDRTGNGPAVSIGMKAGFNTIDIMRGAIEESLMSRTWLRDTFIYTRKEIKLPKKIKILEQRAFYWFKPNTIDYLDFLFAGNKINKPDMDPHKKEDNYLEKAVRALRKRAIDMYYADITPKEIRRAGLTVVKVLIPKLCPIYFDERYPYYGIDRVYDVPIQLELLKKRKTESELNTIPHPFL